MKFLSDSIFVLMDLFTVFQRAKTFLYPEREVTCCKQQLPGAVQGMFWWCSEAFPCQWNVFCPVWAGCMNRADSWSSSCSYRGWSLVKTKGRVWMDLCSWEASCAVHKPMQIGWDLVFVWKCKTLEVKGIRLLPFELVLKAQTSDSVGRSPAHSP